MIVDHIFIRCDTQTLWNLWWGGDKSKRIPPYRSLRSYDVPQNNKSALSKAGTIVNVLLEMEGKTKDEVRKLSLAQRDQIFKRSFSAVCVNILYPDKTLTEIDCTGVGKQSFLTIYDKLLEYSKEIEFKLPTYESK